jgi:hypothetical protein
LIALPVFIALPSIGISIIFALSKLFEAIVMLRRKKISQQQSFFFSGALIVFSLTVI